MANETTTAILTNLVKTAFDKVVDLQLWSEPMFRKFATHRQTDLTSPGSSVTWYVHTDLADAVSTLNEVTDPTPVAMSNPSATTVSLAEYGNATVSTLRLREFSMSTIDTAQAELVARNLRNSLDTIVGTVLRGGTNVVYSGGASAVDTTGPTNAVAAADIFNSKLARWTVAKMRGRNALEFDDGYFIGLIHPDQSHDLRAETGTAAWRDPHVYGENANGMIWKGEVGVYEGIRWIETPRIYTANDGTTSQKVYRSLVLGKEALAELVSIEPSVVVAPQTDMFRRLLTVGWYGMFGHAIWRQECLQRIETAASI